jgi:hypothetical protein
LPGEIGKEPYSHKPAYYWASDNPHPDNNVKHSHRGIGFRYSRFKMSEPITWEGLRLCFHDPETRIRPPAEDELSHPVIEEVKIEGGFLDDTNIQFNPNLNCLIGGRGTGKSCTLELLRYAFNIDAKTDSNLTQSQDLVKNTFPAGSRISVRFSLGQGSVYNLERIANLPPIVTREGSDVQLEILPVDLLPVQVYGQKEVFEISKDPTFQLRLLDNYLSDFLKPLVDNENDLLRRLRDNAAAILGLEEQTQDVEEQISKLGAVEEEIRRMEEQDFVNRLREKSQFDQEHELIQDAQGQIDKLITDLSSFQSTHRLKLSRLEDDSIAELPNKELLSELLRSLKEVDDRLGNDIQALVQKIKGIWEESRDRREIWQAAYENQNDSYNDLLLAFQTIGKSLKPERYIELKAEQRRLSQMADENEERRAALSSLWKDRSDLIADLRKIRRSQYEMRCRKAEELTKALGGKIRITIWPQGHRKPYQEELVNLFEGTRARKEVIEQLATAKAEKPERAAQKPVDYHGETSYLISEIPRYLDQIDLAKAIRTQQNSASTHRHKKAWYYIVSALL